MPPTEIASVRFSIACQVQKRRLCLRVCTAPLLLWCLIRITAPFVYAGWWVGALQHSSQHCWMLGPLPGVQCRLHSLLQRLIKTRRKPNPHHGR